MTHVVSELTREIKRQELTNWSDDAFELIEPGVTACSSCCLLSSGGNPPREL